MKAKKAQVTIFIIAGILIVIIVGVVFYSSRTTEKRAAKTELKKAGEARLETQPIKTFIEQCIDTIARDGLELLGRQGGRLSTVQGGTLPSFKNVNEVSYAIYPPSPYIDEPYSAGLYGDDNLPSLTREGPQSIQLQLERYILSRIDECDLSTFEEQGFTITREEPAAEATLAKDTVDIILSYPLQIESTATGATTSISEFSSSQNIRFGRIYTLAADLVRLDTTNATFDISSRANFREGMGVEVVRDAAGKDDIITITDPGSLIKGNPYEFKFARYNRKPAPYPIVPVDDISAFSEGDTISLENITATPEEDIKADDPDEDSPLTVFFQLFYPLDDSVQPLGGFSIDAGVITPAGSFPQAIQCNDVVQVCARDNSDLRAYCLNLGSLTC